MNIWPFSKKKIDKPVAEKPVEKKKYKAPICPNCKADRVFAFYEKVHAHEIYYHHKDESVYIHGAYYTTDKAEKPLSVWCQKCGSRWEDVNEFLDFYDCRCWRGIHHAGCRLCYGNTQTIFQATYIPLICYAGGNSRSCNGSWLHPCV